MNTISCPSGRGVPALFLVNVKVFPSADQFFDDGPQPYVSTGAGVPVFIGLLNVIETEAMLRSTIMTPFGWIRGNHLRLQGRVRRILPHGKTEIERGKEVSFLIAETFTRGTGRIESETDDGSRGQVGSVEKNEFAALSADPNDVIIMPWRLYDNGRPPTAADGITLVGGSEIRPRHGFVEGDEDSI